jgi:hypothetical protein
VRSTARSRRRCRYPDIRQVFGRGWETRAVAAKIVAESLAGPRSSTLRCRFSLSLKPAHKCDFKHPSPSSTASSATTRPHQDQNIHLPSARSSSTEFLGDRNFIPCARDLLSCRTERHGPQCPARVAVSGYQACHIEVGEAVLTSYSTPELEGEVDLRGALSN